MQTDILLTKWNIPVLLCWIGVVGGIVGMASRMDTNTSTSLWLSVVALVVSGIGISIGGPLKTIKTRAVGSEKRGKDQ